MFQTRTAMNSKASIALMKFLSRLARKLGVSNDVYVVGGAVRNFALNVPIKDIDVVIDTVNSGRDSQWFAEQVARVIPVQTSINTNNYGVALLKVVGPWILEGESLQGEDIEIANARKESYSEGGYKPTEVLPATMQEDVVRRELTFNSLMWRLHDLADGPDRAEIIDLTGCGLRDLQEGVMRCPSDPDRTFTDDPSRIVRVVKFLVKYGFKIAPDVRAAIARNLQKIKNIPPSHLSNMLIETFLREPTGKKALIEMDKLGILDVVKEIAQTNRSFREALSNWADREASLEFLFDLMDLGFPVGNKLGFLKADQKRRVREVTVGLSPEAAEDYVAALKQPGRIMDTPSLMKEFNLKGPAVRQLMETAQRLLLADPALVVNGKLLTEKVRQVFARLRV